MMYYYWKRGKSDMLDKDQKYIIRELNNYNYLYIKLAEMTEAYAHSIKYIEDCIERIDKQLNEYHVPAINYNSVSIAKVPSKSDARIIELITEQDILKKRKEDKEKEQQKEIDMIVSRIESMDKMLDRLTSWERLFITYMYITPKGMEYMMDQYRYKSKTSVYNTANRLLDKMIGRKKVK